MNAIHIIMATSTSANPHNSPNEHIESIARRRKISGVTFLVFGLLLITAGLLLASFESQRFSVSFIVFGTIGIIFAFVYWVSAEKLLITLRKMNVQRLREAQMHVQNAHIHSRNFNHRTANIYSNSIHVGLPSYDQSVLPPSEIPPSYDEAIKSKSNSPSANVTNQVSSSNPIHSISLTVDQNEDQNTSSEILSR